MNAGNEDRWDRAGKYLGSVTLIGFGSLFNESNYPQNRIFGGMDFHVDFQGSYLAYSEGHLSAWDEGGTHIGTTELLTAGQTLDSYFSVSVTDGMVWVVDEPGSLWKGYELQVVPEQATFVTLAAGVGPLLRRRRR